MKNIGRSRLPELLSERHMTATELSSRSGFSAQQISNWVNNRRRMSLPNAKVIADILRCPIDELYEWTESGDE